MAHVHGEKMVQAAAKAVEESCPFHAAGEMMGQGGGMNMGSMMKSGMGGMMEHGAGMGGMMGGMMEHGAGMGGMMGSGMGHMMGAGMEGMKGMMMGSGTGTAMMTAPRAVAAGAATGAAVTAASAAKHSLFRRIVTHPLVLFGAGLAIGYLIHKYREEIIQKAGEVTE